MFGSEAKDEPQAPAVDLKTLHEKIGELTLVTIFGKHSRQGGPSERKTMIDCNHDLPMSRQAKELGISRRSIYYLPHAVSTADMALVRRIDEPHMDYPFAGSRILQWLLRAEGHPMGRLHVSTLMHKMGI